MQLKCRTMLPHELAEVQVIPWYKRYKRVQKVNRQNHGRKAVSTVSGSQLTVGSKHDVLGDTA